MAIEPGKGPLTTSRYGGDTPQPPTRVKTSLRKQLRDKATSAALHFPIKNRAVRQTAENYPFRTALRDAIARGEPDITPILFTYFHETTNTDRVIFYSALTAELPNISDMPTLAAIGCFLEDNKEVMSSIKRHYRYKQAVNHCKVAFIKAMKQEMKEKIESATSKKKRGNYSAEKLLDEIHQLVLNCHGLKKTTQQKVLSTHKLALRVLAYDLAKDYQLTTDLQDNPEAQEKLYQILAFTSHSKRKLRSRTAKMQRVLGVSAPQSHFVSDGKTTPRKGLLRRFIKPRGKTEPLQGKKAQKGVTSAPTSVRNSGEKTKQTTKALTPLTANKVRPYHQPSEIHTVHNKLTSRPWDGRLSSVKPRRFFFQKKQIHPVTGDGLLDDTLKQERQRLKKRLETHIKKSPQVLQQLREDESARQLLINIFRFDVSRIKKTKSAEQKLSTLYTVLAGFSETKALKKFIRQVIHMSGITMRPPPSKEKGAFLIAPGKESRDGGGGGGGGGGGSDSDDDADSDDPAQTNEEEDE